MSHQPPPGESPQSPGPDTNSSSNEALLLIGSVDEGISNSKITEGSNSEDMINELPRDLTACILERMPIQHAVRTSALSRNWKDKWTSIRNLSFDMEFFEYLEHVKSLPSSVYFQIIHSLLLDHDGTIDSFTLFVPYTGTPVVSPTTDMYNCLNLLSSKDVKDLTIEYDGRLEMHKEDDNRVLTPLYFCFKITRLRITNCGLFRPPSFSGFPNLVVLHCTFINFCNDSFECLMSSCPLLEAMSLLNCSGPAEFDICSTRLEHLELSLSSESITKINAKNLKSLCIFRWEEHDSPYDPVMLPTLLESLQEMYIVDLCLANWEDVILFIRLVYVAPNLQDLVITTSPGDEYMDRVIELLEVNMNWKLDSLKKVKVHIWNGSKDELTVIKLLLALSPSLKKMIIVLDNVDEKTVCKALAAFPRASPIVEVIIEVNRAMKDICDSMRGGDDQQLSS